MLNKTLLVASTLAVMSFGFTPAVFADDHEGKKGPGAGHFEEVDTDGDGKISKAEFLASQEKHFVEIDADGDGYVTKEEKQAKMEEMREKFKEKREEWKEKRGERADKRDEATDVAE